MESLTPRQREFCDAVAELLAKYSDVAGPVETEGQLNTHLDAEHLADSTPVANAALSEWVVVTSWVDMDSGEVYTSKFCLPGMPSYHQLGMLTQWTEALK